MSTHPTDSPRTGSAATNAAGGSASPSGPPAALTREERVAIMQAADWGTEVAVVERILHDHLRAQRESIATAIEARIAHAPDPTPLAVALFDEAARTARTT